MSDLELPEGLSLAGPEDWQRVGDITAETFANDPVTSWTFGNVEAMRPAFRALARQVYIPRGICHLSEHGATQWLPPGASKNVSIWQELGLALRIIQKSGFGAISRALTADKIMSQYRPKDPHFYLFTIGVLEAARGTGLGRKLMAPMLDVADREGMPVYLENSNPANTGFYQSHGFVRQQIFHPGDGAPPLEAMMRVPRERM